MKKIFVSYSHQDKEYLDRIRQKLLDTELDLLWIDQEEIKPGDIWARQLNQNLQSATAALILAGDNYFKSNFIQKNEYPVLIKKAKQETLSLYWIPVNYRDYGDDFKAFQALLDPNTPLISFEKEAALDKTIHEICAKLRDRIKHIFPQPDQKQVSAQQPHSGYVKVVGLRTGLYSLMDAIHQQIENAEEVVLLRSLPFEIVPSMLRIARHKDETMAVVQDYLKFIEEVILGGEIGNSFWDKTIYGRVAINNNSRAQIFNEGTWEFVKRIYFGEVLPDTTVLGINPDIKDDEWVFIVGTSDNQDEVPNNFICTLKLRPEGDFLSRPRRGEFTTNPEEVKKSYEEFMKTLSSLEARGLCWTVLEPIPEEVEKIQEQVKSFLIDGTLS